MSEPAGAADRRLSALLEDVIDAARVTDDFVRGVLDNVAGRPGGDTEASRGWRRWVPGSAMFGERARVQGMAVQYGPEQLRKAAVQAQELEPAIAAVEACPAAAAAVAAELRASGAGEVAPRLSDPELEPRSPGVAEVHRILMRIQAIANEARTKAILAEMRAARGGADGDARDPR
jgi:hypothetical protein